MIFSLSALLAVSSFVSANMIKNGNFDHTRDFCPKNLCLLTNTSAIAPWTITSNFKLYQLYEAHTTFGSWVADLNSYGGTTNPSPMNTYGQNVETVQGKKYLVSFQMTGSKACGTFVSKTGFVRATGSEQQDFAYVEAERDGKWTEVNYLFVASGVSTMIEIGSTTRNSECGPMVAAISMLPAGQCSASDLAAQRAKAAKHEDYTSY